MQEKKYIVCSCSMGKDSLCTTLKLMELNMLNEVVFYDTGMEFRAIYNNAIKLQQICQNKGIEFTWLHAPYDFEYMMWEKPVKKRKDNAIHYGYSWCGGLCRWGTTDKVRIVDKYVEEMIFSGIDVAVAIGIAVDEPARTEKKIKPYKFHPLVEWDMTEADCLQYCYDKGFDWLETDSITGNTIDLYQILDRVSCWCCANKNLKELKNIYLFLPEYWEKLKIMQTKTDRPFKSNQKKGFIYTLEERFEREVENGKL